MRNLVTNDPRDSMDGRKVKLIELSETESITTNSYGGVELILVEEFYGDHGEDWIAVKKDGKEVSRWRCGALRGIMWEDAP